MNRQAGVKRLPSPGVGNNLVVNWELFGNSELSLAAYYAWMSFSTAHIRSLREGNVFSHVCFSLYKEVSM